ncbi:hypothetical protein [uncultured Thiodictyon sp.]|uniref:hypothetical protein n=1 Tax=uncultured Thiodictyon sp. TaxID=1846217 RepID=UPI0025E8E204|nr:hypothetical protein [uncultured Thiodictyon sp.]
MSTILIPLSNHRPAPPQRTDRLLTLGAAALMLAVLALTYLVYRPGLAGPFLLDDETNIAATRVEHLTSASLRGQLLDGDEFGGLSRGMTRLSFTLTQYFSGNEPYVFKYQNLLLHLLNALLVFWLLYLLARQATRAPDTAAPAWFALAAAGLWVLHPLQVSTVLYAVQRLVLLASLFTLGASIFYVKGRLLSATRPLAGALLILFGVGGCWVLGLLSKESAAILPLLLAVIEGIFFRFRTQGMRQRWTLPLLWLLLIVLPLVLGAVYLVPRLPDLLGWHAGRGYSGVQRLMTQAHVIALYIKLFFLPIPGTMSLFHDAFPITRQMDVATAMLAGFYAALGLSALIFSRPAPWFSFGILWFFACHVIESTVIPLEMVFEHRNYLATVGLAALLVYAVTAMFSSIDRGRLAAPVIVTLALLIAFNTATRARVWADYDAMLAMDYRYRPDSPRVLGELITRESTQGHQATAVALLQRLVNMETEDATPALLALQLYCHEAVMPTLLYRRALDRLTKGLITPETVTTLATFSNIVLQGRCSALAAEQLDALTHSAFANPRARVADERCLAGEVRTRVLIALSRWEEAQTDLAQTLDYCASAKPRNRRFVIDNLLRFAADYGASAQTEAMLRTLTREPARRAALDRAFAAEGGFNLQLAVERASK